MINLRNMTDTLADIPATAPVTVASCLVVELPAEDFALDMRFNSIPIIEKAP